MPLLLWLILLCLPASASGQTTAVVAGRVVDATSGVPIGFGTIVVETATGEPVSGALGGENGRFLVQGLEPGSYRIRISFPGYQPVDTEVLVSPLNRAYDLGDVRLPRLAGYEETITVNANAIRVAGVDTQVFRLDEGAAQSTGSLLDALKGLPGVTVDEDGRVTLRGSDQVAILIDGRPSSLTGFGTQRGLDSVPAANIEAIEIINNPSARFDAAGMAGIINIIYKQERQKGFSGDVGLNVGIGQFTKQRADLPTDIGSFSTNGKIIPNFNLSYTTERFRSFAQGEVLFQDDLPNNEFTTRFYDDGRVIESQVPENREQNHYTVRLGTDWTIDRARTLSVSGIYDFERHTDIAQVPFILRSTGARERFWFWREREDTGFANGTVDFKQRFGTPGHELDVNLQYTRGREDEAYFLNEVSRVREGTDTTHLVATEHTLPLSIDYTRPLPTGRLELGGKVQRRWIPVSYTVERGARSVIYPGLGDYSDWDENILAGYANLVRVRAAYTLEAGLRAEQHRCRLRDPGREHLLHRQRCVRLLRVVPEREVHLSARRPAPSRRGLQPAGRSPRRAGAPDLPEVRRPRAAQGRQPLPAAAVHARPRGRARPDMGRRVSHRGLYHRDITDAFSRIFAIDDSNPDYDIVNRMYENAGNSTQTGVQVIGEHAIIAPWRVTGSVNSFATISTPSRRRCCSRPPGPSRSRPRRTRRGTRR